MNIDPVCGMKVDEKNAPAKSEYNGKTFTFCSEECKKRFDQSPEQYAQRVA
jgi:YHS domain-containing protein